MSSDSDRSTQHEETFRSDRMVSIHASKQVLVACRSRPTHKEQARTPRPRTDIRGDQVWLQRAQSSAGPQQRRRRRSRQAEELAAAGQVSACPSLTSQPLWLTCMPAHAAAHVRMRAWQSAGQHYATGCAAAFTALCRNDSSTTGAGAQHPPEVHCVAAVFSGQLCQAPQAAGPSPRHQQSM